MAAFCAGHVLCRLFLVEAQTRRRDASVLCVDQLSCDCKYFVRCSFLSPLRPANHCRTRGSRRSRHCQTWPSSSRAGALRYGRAALCLIAWPLTHAVMSAYSLTQTDTRTLAKEWFDAHVPAGSKVLIEGGKIAASRLTVPLDDSRESLERRIAYWKVKEPRQAKFLELKRAVHQGGGYDLELVRVASIAPLDDYTGRGIEYFVVRPEFFMGSRKAESGSARLLSRLRSDTRVKLLKQFKARYQHTRPARQSTFTNSRAVWRQVVDEMSEHLKILFVVHNQTRKGGAYYRGLNLGAPLARRGHDVTLMSIHPSARSATCRARAGWRETGGVSGSALGRWPHGLGPLEHAQANVVDSTASFRRHSHCGYATGRVAAGNSWTQGQWRRVGC